MFLLKCDHVEKTLSAPWHSPEMHYRRIGNEMPPELGTLARSFVSSRCFTPGRKKRLNRSSFEASMSIFEDVLIRGKRRYRLAWLAIPCLVSYTYPLALVARTLGWYLQYTRHQGRRLRLSSVLIARLFSRFVGCCHIHYRPQIQSG